MAYPLTYDSSTASSSLKYPYLRFDAFSMKDLINAKLSEDARFTDFAYSGSNLSIFIDIVSEMFACLMYNLNYAASESMLSDSNIYGNVSRLVKFLGYSPAGYKTSSVTVDATAVTFDKSFLIVPKYSKIVLKETDSFGKNITFSTDDYFHINGDSVNKITLYNGYWCKYANTFTSTGEPYEKFVLNGISLEGDSTEYVAYPFIDVYVKRYIGNGKYKTIYFAAVTDGLFLNSNDNTILSPNDNKFYLRLNENKKYEIEFGDGIHGAKLQKGDVVHVLYLNSNGDDGKIAEYDINEEMFEVSIDGISEGTTGRETLTLDDILETINSEDNTIKEFSSIIGKYTSENADTLKAEKENNLDNSDRKTTFYYSCTNHEASSSTVAPETVSQIKENAPYWFTRMGRTVTTNDYTTYIKERFYSDIVDVVVMNNYKYAATFYNWLAKIGTEKLNNPKKWLNPSLTSLGTYGYKYSDTSDSNNIYIWIKQEIESTSVGQSIIDDLMDEKVLTSEPVVVSAVDVRFALCGGMTDTRNDDGSLMTLRDFYNLNGTSEDKQFVFDDKGQNRLEIEVNSGLNVSAAIIKNRVLSIFKNFFSVSTMNIGGTVNIGDLESQILGIDGVKRIRTIFRKLKSDGTYSTEDIMIRNGISLAHWNETIVNGYDIDYTNANVMLEEFQYPVYNDFSTIIEQIDVVANGSTNLSTSDEY